MSRHPRIVLPGVPLHIIQRGNNRRNCFFEPSDYRVFISLLAHFSRACRCPLHAYVLMSNHIHLLATPETPSAPAELMKNVGQQYVQYVNRKHDRFGTLWQGRYRSCVVEQERYFLVCQRYIELNPVRAGIVPHPVDYEWSSYRANAHGERNPAVQPHPLYTGISSDKREREASYRALVAEAIPHGILQELRQAANRNTVLGSLAFSQEVGATLGRDLSPQITGRKGHWKA